MSVDGVRVCGRESVVERVGESVWSREGVTERVCWRDRACGRVSNWEREIMQE